MPKIEQADFPGFVTELLVEIADTPRIPEVRLQALASRAIAEEFSAVPSRYSAHRMAKRMRTLVADEIEKQKINLKHGTD